MKKEVYYRSFFVRYNLIWAFSSFFLGFFFFCAWTNEIFFSLRTLLVFLSVWSGQCLLLLLLMQLVSLYVVSYASILISGLTYFCSVVFALYYLFELSFPLVLVSLLAMYLITSVFLLKGLSMDLHSSLYGGELQRSNDIYRKMGKDIFFKHTKLGTLKLIYWDERGVILESKQNPKLRRLQFSVSLLGEDYELELSKVAYFSQENLLNLRFLTSQKSLGSIKLIEKLQRLGWSPGALT